MTVQVPNPSVTKTMVMENYRSGNSAFSTIIPSDQIINLFEDTAVVSLNLELKGNYHEQLVSAEIRYIRVWKLFTGNWRVITVSVEGKWGNFRRESSNGKIK